MLMFGVMALAAGNFAESSQPRVAVQTATSGLPEKKLDWITSYKQLSKQYATPTRKLRFHCFTFNYPRNKRPKSLVCV